ncbi:MAG: SDR family oxidoreductase [Parvularculaceae bacterium]|nr:SDR family oxidoreductase [Parvularculaceae bacterium]
MHKPVLVTGASSGIGEAAAVTLARAGFRVFAAARRIEKLKAIEGLGEGRITALALDVTDEGSIAAAAERFKAEGAVLYGLVNNAGISVTGPIEEVPLAEWRAQFETNLFGVVAVTKAFLPAMRAARAGRIVNIGSVSGRLAPPFMGAYAASKHALEGFNDSLRRELAPYGIKVSLIRPGFIHTPFGGPEQEGLSRYVGPGHPYSERVAAFKAWHAKGHPNGAPPSAVADAIAQALTAARPHSRYTVPASVIPPVMLRNLLPSAIVDRAFAATTGIDRRKEAAP